MEKSEWGECWAHFVSALGLPDDATRRRQGEAWYHEFARNRDGEVVRRAMRRVLDATPAGQAFPDLGLAREHFRIEDRVEQVIDRPDVPRCQRCQGSGRITLAAYRSGQRVLWMNVEDFFDAFEKLPIRTAKVQVQCECPLGVKYAKFPVAPPDARGELERYESMYGAAVDARPTDETTQQVA